MRGGILKMSAKYPYGDEDHRSCYCEQKIIKVANETAYAQDRTKE